MAIYKVKPNQNLFDVALHLYGTIEGLFDILISNPHINMTSELVYGQELVYHEGFVINPSIVQEFATQNITPSSGCGKVKFKSCDGGLVLFTHIDPKDTMASFAVSGTAGTLWVDWGDNSEMEEVKMGLSSKEITHFFDNDTDDRIIKVYADSDLKILSLDTTGLNGDIIICRPIWVNHFKHQNSIHPLTGLALLLESHTLELQNRTIESLLPIGDLQLQRLDLTNSQFANEDVLDDYLEYIVAHHQDRRPCTILITEPPGKRGYAAIDAILNEPEWNLSGTWKFYINNQLYQPTNGTNS